MAITHILLRVLEPGPSGAVRREFNQRFIVEQSDVPRFNYAASLVGATFDEVFMRTTRTYEVVNHIGIDTLVVKKIADRIE